MSISTGRFAIYGTARKNALPAISRVIHAVPESDGGKESTVSQTIDDTRETPGDTPVTPLRRAQALTLMPVHLESDDEGPKRLTWHERVPEEGHQRGR